MATRPTPKRRVARVAATAPMNDENPPTPATRPITAGPSWSSSRTNRNQTAPKMPHSAARAIWAPANARRIGSWRTSRSPSRISLSTGSRSSRGGGGASGTRIVHSSTRRGDVAHRVDGDRDRRGQELDEEAADPEGGELRGRAAGGEGRVGVDQSLALDDRRQVGVVGGVEERRQDRRQRNRRPAVGRTSGRRARTRPGSSRGGPPGRGPPRSGPAGGGVDRPTPRRPARPRASRRARGRAGRRPRTRPTRGRGSPRAAAPSA